MRNPLALSEEEAWALLPIMGSVVFDMVDDEDDYDYEDEDDFK